MRRGNDPLEIGRLTLRFVRAARQLQNMGFEATTLLAGYEACKERYPVEPADEQRVAWSTR
jgi:hypothetical protein